MRARVVVALAFTALNPNVSDGRHPGVRNAHSMAYDTSLGRVLMFGGADERTVRGDLWAWDGRDWTPLADGGPPPRTFAAMAYDAARRRLVLVGGNRVLFGSEPERDSTLGDMWEWSDGAWHEVRVSTPPPRAEAAMIYDSERRRLVLFGGYRGAGAGRVRLGDTWEWNGEAWEERRPAVAPSPRNGAAMAYDAGRRRVVLFGGNGPSPETWEWDGTAWTLVAAPTPGRFNSTVAYHAAQKRVLRFGGWNGKERQADTWTYDGSAWERLAQVGPAARNHSGLVYDDRRGVLVLFAGHDGERVFGDTWEWRDGAWVQASTVPPRVRVENGH